MISKRTAVIVIIAIVAILSFETFYGLDKMGQMEKNLEHTVVQVTVNLDGKLLNLEGVALSYEYSGGKKPITATLGTLNETGFEELKNNSVGFQPCGIGSNRLSITIPKEFLSAYPQDIDIIFGCDNNEAEFNNYSLIVNLTTEDGNLQADVAQSLYYPDEKGNALSKKQDVSATLSTDNNIIECIIPE